eukprot:3735500-Rhodomonas_salina.1
MEGATAASRQLRARYTTAPTSHTPLLKRASETCTTQKACRVRIAGGLSAALRRERRRGRRGEIEKVRLKPPQALPHSTRADLSSRPHVTAPRNQS